MTDREISRFESIHCGEEILILGNGPSSKTDLRIVDIPIIGLNQAWRLRKCNYYAMGDPEQYAMFPCFNGPLISTLFTPETGPEYAVKIQAHHNDPQHPKRFSFDLMEGIYLNNTIASFGFQLAVWMLGHVGTVYMLGIDSDGPQFDGSPMPSGTFENQRETLGYIAGVLSVARPGIEIYDLSPVSKQRVFERKKFDEVFG